MKLFKYTEDQLKVAVQSSRSLRQTLIKLGVAPYGGNYDVLKKALIYFEIDTSHFVGKAWNKGQRLPSKRSTEDYLSNHIPIQSFKLKNRLVKEGYLNRACNQCKLTLWLNKPIPLELDHVNGNNKDNRLVNLRLLCPNCHALTSTYRGKNRSKA